MSAMIIAVLALVWLILGLGCWLGWQLLRQNGRILLRLDELEKRLEELEFGEPGSIPQNAQSGTAAGNADDLGGRFASRSLARSRIKRDGLNAGTSAPHFRLPCVDGSGELSLEELRGRRVLLVFSDPHCEPCQVLAPELEKFHQSQKNKALTPSNGKRGISVVMISRGEAKENRVKVKEHGLTFPVVLQQRWEISRLYAMFATPVAYLVDEQGVIVNDVAVGVKAILSLMAEAKEADLNRQRTAALQDAGAMA